MCINIFIVIYKYYNTQNWTVFKNKVLKYICIPYMYLAIAREKLSDFGTFILY